MRVSCLYMCAWLPATQKGFALGASRDDIPHSTNEMLAQFPDVLTRIHSKKLSLPALSHARAAEQAEHTGWGWNWECPFQPTGHCPSCSCSSGWLLCLAWGCQNSFQASARHRHFCSSSGDMDCTAWKAKIWIHVVSRNMRVWESQTGTKNKALSSQSWPFSVLLHQKEKPLWQMDSWNKRCHYTRLLYYKNMPGQVK